MNHGREWTAKDSADSDELRATTQRLNAESPSKGEWVPKAAISIPEWQVRGLNEEKVREYAEVYGDLPPIRVQRDTFVLIDGRHRFSAEPSDLVRIIEDDIADADLFVESVRANVGHGLPYTRQERLPLVQELLKRYPRWSDAKVAETAGVAQNTVGGTRRTAQPAENGQVESTREGRDGRVRDVSRSLIRPRATTVHRAAPAEPAPETLQNPWEGETFSAGDWGGPERPVGSEPEEPEGPRDQASNDEEPELNVQRFYYIRDAFELKASALPVVANLRGAAAERFVASLRDGLSELRQWCEHMELEYVE